MPITRPLHTERGSAIAQARERMLLQGQTGVTGLTAPWVERSWHRCLGAGMEPGQPVHFDLISPAHRVRTQQDNAHLLRCAQGIMQGLGKAIAHTGYFAILTNAQGVVLDTSGPIDAQDPRAAVITRIGTDLSERAIGTSAIGTALAEQQPVWLHRGEHFFLDNAHYTCAGAPLTDPAGRCIGMLDLTGIDVPERTELKHLVMQSVAQIDNALVLATRHQLLLRLNWPGHGLGSTADALVALDGDGCVSGANAVARQIVPGVAVGVPADRLFAVPFQAFFDTAQRQDATLDVALHNGLRLRALATRQRGGNRSAIPEASATVDGVPIRQMQASMIRQAMEQAGGNVTEAALALGISRATLYRKLANKA